MEVIAGCCDSSDPARSIFDGRMLHCEGGMGVSINRN